MVPLMCCDCVVFYAPTMVVPHSHYCTHTYAQRAHYYYYSNTSTADEDFLEEKIGEQAQEAWRLTPHFLGG